MEEYLDFWQSLENTLLESVDSVTKTKEEKVDLLEGKTAEDLIDYLEINDAKNIEKLKGTKEAYVQAAQFGLLSSLRQAS